MLAVAKEKTSYQLAVEAVKVDLRETRKQRIQSLFKEVGAMSTHAFVMRCIERGIFTDEEQAAAYFAAFAKIVREALGAEDETGLPFAGQTIERDGDGQMVWKQRELWAVADYQLNIDERIADRDANHIVAVRLANECQRRHKQTIMIPVFPVCGPSCDVRPAAVAARHGRRGGVRPSGETLGAASWLVRLSRALQRRRGRAASTRCTTATTPTLTACRTGSWRSLGIPCCCRNSRRWSGG